MRSLPHAHKKAPGLSTWGFLIVSGAPASFELGGKVPVFIGSLWWFVG